MTGPPAGLEVLTPAEMAEADRRAITAGPLDGYGLMRNAGAAVAAELLRRHPRASCFELLCGPGNNGGDGYVVARLLREAGATVRIHSEGRPRAGSDAALAAGDCKMEALPLEAGGFAPAPGSVVVDALYGAGLARPLSAAAAGAAGRCREAGCAVVAVDLPSGVSGDSGAADETCFRAELTITFARMKPGHLLQPGRSLCGEILVADIGIPDHAVRYACGSASWTAVNRPELWRSRLAAPQAQAHKYARGHVMVFSGGPASTGAARLCAMAAARIGAGAVTLASPAAALAVNAAHLTSTMLARIDDAGALDAFLARRGIDAAVIGPGFGDHERLRALALRLLDRAGGLVLDADAFSAFAAAPDQLFAAAAGRQAVLTPHEGEFRRLFPAIAKDEGLSKLERARHAAKAAHCVMVFKGPDTVIAAPDGRAAINENGTPWLATAGSGDVLAGLVAGLLAQKLPAFEAACAAVWMHADAAARFGPGLIADDLPGLIAPVLRDLL